MPARARLLLGLAALALLAACRAPAVPRVIFDTDLDSDVDDVQALAMLHRYADAGLVDLLGVVVASDERYAASCADAVNTFYGRPDLPIGYLRYGGDSLRTFSKYTKHIAAEFPHDVRDSAGTVAAARLYRRLLAASPGASVTVVTVGHLTSLAALLASGPDDLSPLPGETLAARKVARWVCMGGQYPAGKEANFYRPDPASTAYCLAHWRGEAVFSGWELGNRVITGGPRLRAGLAPKHPVYRAYELYNDFAGRPAWDQTAVLLLEPASDAYFERVGGGCVEVAADGSNRWVGGERPRCRHAYLRLREGVDPERVARHIDSIVVTAANPRA